MGGKSPRWEAKLWSYVCSGDGMRCPLYSYCQARRSHNWCAGDNRETLSRIIDSDTQFSHDDYDFVKPECDEAFPFVKLVEKLAQRQLKKGRVRYPPVPNKLVSLASEWYPVEVHYLPLKACHAATWRLRDKWVIQLEGNVTSARNRLNLFHEAFHILAHCNSNARPVFNRRGTKQGSFNELLADYFAICTLMPRDWVREKWAEFEDLDKMALTFDVTKSIMWFRLRELGLL